MEGNNIFLQLRYLLYWIVQCSHFSSSRFNVWLYFRKSSQAGNMTSSQISQIRNRDRETKGLAQGYRATSWQNWCHKTKLLAPKTMFPHCSIRTVTPIREKSLFSKPYWSGETRGQQPVSGKGHIKITFDFASRTVSCYQTDNTFF